MSRKMLIDATHDEETRVAIVDNGRLDEFDYESTFRRPLKGNIYLAKVTRVEPSLQAAFVNYGGNRHGFLPFSEIHPDYFRIPVSDREALIAEQEEEIKAHDEEDDGLDEAVIEDADDLDEDDAQDEVEELGGDLVLGDDEDEEQEEKPKAKRGRKPAQKAKADKIEKSDDQAEEDNVGNVVEDGSNDEPNGNLASDDEDGDDDSRGNSKNDRGGRGRGRNQRGGRNNPRNNSGGGKGRSAQHRSKRVETFEDEMDDDSKFRFNLRRKYKIQEVIKRGQIMLIQVSKEERGNKGAAVGSYLSLPGRYCVLMPNSPRGGGVSRKISNYKDRAKMRDMLKELEIPKGMSVILRTAGITRTKTEIKRDLDYLLRLWNTIREKTMESSAPAVVYEEADLVKRAVRDLYKRDVEEIHVAGAEGYKTAKEFMKMMIPSHAKRVIEYKDENVPLFNKFKVEGQIANIGETSVTLKSGGYLVINPTEALISVDVNSGKATKERHIEDTALKTNLEAAEEMARQLRLRDLGGLIVIDFIDMEDRRNNGKVERKMRDSLEGDRARIQMGRISSFGLMEMSRQRMSPSLTESQYETCSHCLGMGRVRTADAAGIMVLRAIEEEGIKGRASELVVSASSAVALYILNNKRKELSVIEARYGFNVVIRADETLGAAGFRVEVSKPLDKSEGSDDAANEPEAVKPQENRDEKPQRHNHKPSNNDESDDEDDASRRGRRRGRRGGRNRNRNNNSNDSNNDNGGNANDADQGVAAQGDKPAVAGQEEQPKTSSPARAKKTAVKKDADKVEDKSQDKDGNKADDKKAAPVKKPAAKKTVKKDVAQKTDKVETAKDEPQKKSVKASNDDKPVKAAAAKKSEKPKPAEPKEYEVVNETPTQKKKGWWSKK